MEIWLTNKRNLRASLRLVIQLELGTELQQKLILANHADDPTYRELKYATDDLDNEHQIELVALMWLGRGDFTLDQWEEALNESKERWTSRTAEYLIGTPLVADYLEEGLACMAIVAASDLRNWWTILTEARTFLSSASRDPDANAARRSTPQAARQP